MPRSHVERYLGETHATNVAALFAMLRHVKETCRHYDGHLCREGAKSVEFEGDATTAHYLHLVTGAAILRRIRVRYTGQCPSRPSAAPPTARPASRWQVRACVPGMGAKYFVQCDDDSLHCGMPIRISRTADAVINM